MNHPLGNSSGTIAGFPNPPANSSPWTRLPSFRLCAGVLVTAAIGGSLIACTVDTGKKKRTPIDCDQEQCFAALPTEVEDPLKANVNPNSGAFGPAPERPANKDAGSSDAGADDGGVPTKTFCPSLEAGDLSIVEIMITSKAGSGDWGEWVEIVNTRNCWLKLKGLSIESPRGSAAPNVATITQDFELAPHKTFVVADSEDPTKNNGIPGMVVAWNASDVLKNDGDTLNVKLGDTLIDTLTYPAFANLTPGRALSFPSDCTETDRATWARWSLTFDEFTPGFKGTPNADNTDVTCF